MSTMERSAVLARRLYDRFEPIHAVTYFAPDARAAMEAAGYHGTGMGYFAGRSAPLGPVPPEVVTALFYNFADSQAARVLPDAWRYAPPAVALRARAAGAVAALHRCGVAGDDVTRTAAELLTKAAIAGELGGRPLYAANRALPCPTEPVAMLWHATTLLREHRGDGHIAVLAAHGITGRESNVLQVASGRVSREFIMRSRVYDAVQWKQHQDNLIRRGLLDDTGSLTPTGHQLKTRIEDDTDTLALSIWAALDDAELQRLFAVLTPLTRQVVAGGDIPVDTPMGLARHELDDDAAHLF
jgi:hypothetical protein